MAPDLILQHANFNALTEACSQSPLVEHASFSTLPPNVKLFCHLWDIQFNIDVYESLVCFYPTITV